jgi:hypothetical protein
VLQVYNQSGFVCQRGGTTRRVGVCAVRRRRVPVSTGGMQGVEVRTLRTQGGRSAVSGGGADVSSRHLSVVQDALETPYY